MEILTTSTAEQSIRIIPRADAISPTLSLTDKSTRTTSAITVTKTTEEDFMVLAGTFALSEGNQYSFVVKDGIVEIYRGLIFCTDQVNLDKYFINEGEYKSDDSYDNDFVII
jgi:hypothetical protein